MYGARDQFGMQSLYYMEWNEAFIFSTGKLDFLNNMSINIEGLQHYFTYQYIPNPLTLSKDLYALKPGNYFIKEQNKPMECYRYFHAEFSPINTNREEIKHEIRRVITDSVHLQMQTEKPLGSFLSGGIDSSILVAIAKDKTPNLKTFSVGFDIDGYSEIEHAKRTADRLGVENISYVISPEEFVENITKIVSIMDDPLADPSCVPLYIAAREAKKYVSVVLSGEGADELFGGYNIYCEPFSLMVFNSLSKKINLILNKLAAILPEGVRGKSFIERGTTPLELRFVGNAKIFEEHEKMQLIHNYQPELTYHTITKKMYDHVRDLHPVNQMQYIDLHTWLPGNILAKAKQMTLALSLEVRLPFLDTKVFHIAKAIPVQEKVETGCTKKILRDAFKGYLPDEVLYRKKLGFPVPLNHWLQKELYSWAEKLILESKTDYLLNKEVVLQMLRDHGKNKRNHARKIWTVLIFMLWHQIFVEKNIHYQKPLQTVRKQLQHNNIDIKS